MDGGEPGRVRELFQEAVGAIWDGRAESDDFNALVLCAGLTWRQVAIVRTIGKYLRQTRATFSQSYLESALVQNHELARLQREWAEPAVPVGEARWLIRLTDRVDYFSR